MNVLNYFVKCLIAGRKRKKLNKQLIELKRKLEVKKILNCVLIETCKEENCPFLEIIKNDKTIK